MIRRRLHDHWWDRGALWREIQRAKPRTWLDRQLTWIVDREHPTDNSIPLRLYARLICWCHDWRTTWRIRP